MDITRKIEELQAEIEELKDIRHNQGMISAASGFQKERKRLATVPELKFQEVAEKLCLRLLFQHRVDIMAGRRIKKFYIPDFLDMKNKLIFEVDGGYHDTDEQRIKDLNRTKDLNKMGYKVFRITNEEVMSGGTTVFIYKSYHSVGIDIFKEKKKIKKQKNKRKK